MPVPTAQKIRFGAFELDRQSGELYKRGTKLKLQGQPIAVLTLLLERPGELVTREEIRKHLWPEDTFVDFEHSLNTHIKKLRQVFDDDAETPRYIETLPRRGYRFIAQVEAVANGGAAKETAENVSGRVAADSQGLKPGDRFDSLRHDQGRALIRSGHEPSTSAAREAEPFQNRAAEQRSQPMVEVSAKRGRGKYEVAVAVILVAAAGALYWWLRPRTPVVTGIHQLTRTGHPKGFAFAMQQVVTDGVRVYFPEGTLGHGRPIRIAQVATKGGEVSYLELSSLRLPNLVGGFAGGAELLVVDLLPGDSEGPVYLVTMPSGTPRKFADVTAAFAALFPDGKRLVFNRGSRLPQLQIANLTSEGARSILDAPYAVERLAVSPDGARIRFDMADRIWETAADGAGLHSILPRLTGSLCCGTWSAGGEFYAFGRLEDGIYNLWAVSETRRWGRSAASKPFQLTFGPISFGEPAFSPDGRQIFAIGKVLRGELSVYDKSTGQFQPYLNGISAGELAASPDGQWVAYVTYPQNALWRSRADGSEAMQLTFPPMGPLLNPRWSPDGKLIAFTEWGTAEKKVYVVPSNGGEPLLLLSGSFSPSDPTWSPDGKSIAYSGVSIQDGTGTEVRILDLATGQSRAVPGSQHMFSARWSPNGRYLVAQSDDFQKLFLYDFETGLWSQLKSAEAGSDWPVWSHDGRYLYVMRGSSVYRLRIPDGRAEIVVDLTPMDMTNPTFPGIPWFGLTSDDRVVILRDRGSDELYALDLEYR